MSFKHRMDMTYTIPVIDDNEGKLESSTFTDSRNGRIVELVVADYSKRIDLVAQLNVVGAKALVAYLNDYIEEIEKTNQTP